MTFRSDVIPDFLREGIAVDYAKLICIRKGRAILSVNYLGAHFRDSRDVGFYAEKMHIEPKYLSNIVMTKTGMTAKAAIDESTVMQIKLSLKTSSRPVKDIVWDYNFSSPAFFSEYFKRHTGLTPARFREMK